MFIKLLHICNNHSALNLVREKLERINFSSNPESYELHDANSYSKGQWLLVSQNTEFNVVLLDINMSKIEEQNLIEELLLLRSNIPVIIYSQTALDNFNKKKIMEAGAYAIFDLSTNIDELIKLVDKAGAHNLSKVNTSQLMPS